MCVELHNINLTYQLNSNFEELSQSWKNIILASDELLEALKPSPGSRAEVQLSSGLSPTFDSRYHIYCQIEMFEYSRKHQGFYLDIASEMQRRSQIAASAFQISSAQDP